jgi:hypothetical protein
MVDRDGAHVDELCQIVLVWDIVSVPRHHVEGRMLLGTAEKLATKFVHNLPRLFLDFVLGNWVQEVSSVGEAICS